MRRLWWGIILIIIGLWIWFSYLGIPFLSFGRDWPLIIIVWGIWKIVKAIRRATCCRKVKVNMTSESKMTDTEKGGKTLKIHVWDKSSGKTKVNIKIPVGLVKFGSNFIPADAKIKISEEKIDMEKILDAIENNVTGKILEIDNGDDKVEVFIE